ncbi:MAG: hypothetical protein A7316_00320 [Candidatus Altiarchaeales archaeon WOR_SM1_86-2]|nr:MAG: hypothetical protein A7316_00320 [Candidatus Altiarchaeales archaeon WOR_SM1_86-2]ODS41311.1 MAG: hypothetical protein A7315_06625 [Candidatus Altiarchaeales archaeon WOR_SM1_79]
MAESQDKGKEFENKVAELYRLMGHEVKQNVGILGHQIDIILEYTMPGGIKAKTAVECKYVEKGNLKKNDAMDNINAQIDLKRNDEVQNLTIVTTNGFAKAIWDTTKANKIPPLTFRELQHQISNIDPYLEHIINLYESDEISKYYVDFTAQDDEKEPREVFDPIDNYINNWLSADEINHISILGEYGTGKTSFCMKLAHDMAEKYKKDPLNNRIPILISLRDYSKVMSVRQLITDLLINEYGLQGVNFPLFQKMNEEGLFLLIFDGFDEMAQKVIFDDAYSNFNKIAELAKPKKSKVILTCRTEFFRTYEKEKEILLDIDKRRNFDIIYLKEFDDDQIKEFLQKRVPLIEKRKKKKKDWEYYYKKIYEVFELKDLAKRPVLLELIAKYLPQLIELGEEINASTLYKTTIHEELKRRLKVGKTIIQRDDRIKLMKLLAVWMYNNDKLSVYHEDVPELLNLKVHFEIKIKTDIEYHLNDFLTCSFLNRDTEGNYQFSHKSFVDFLVAWKFADDIKENFRDDFMQKQVSYEVMQFMREFRGEINRDELYQWIDFTKGKSFTETKYLGGNAVSVLNELKENFSEKEFDFSETVLDCGDFEGQDLSGLNFQKANLKNANLSSTILENADFSYADLDGVTFEEMGAVYSVFVTPDKKHIVSGSYDGTIKIWDFGGKEIRTLKGHGDLVWSVSVTLDGKYIVSGSMDKTVKIWDFEKGEEIRTLVGHKDALRSVFVTPDIKYIVSGSEDRTIKIWNFESGECIRTIEQKLECSGMNIKNAQGLSKEEIKFLKESGAVEK